MAGEISRRLKDIVRGTTSTKMAQEAFKFFRGVTPIREGNARRNTFLKVDTIEAAYPYAQRLDTGWSNQAPDGMTKPTEEHMRQWIKRQSKGR